MSSTEFLSKNVFFTTRQYAVATKAPVETASRQLQRLAGEGAIENVTRGVWCQMHHPFYSRYEAVPYLLGNEHGYISFLTALHRHGVLSQIPRAIQVATTGRGRKLTSSIGEFEFFHIQPRWMREGVIVSEGKFAYNMASPEKALLDTLYLSTRKGRRFSRLPELDLEGINVRKVKDLMSHSPPGVAKLLAKRLQWLGG